MLKYRQRVLIKQHRTEEKAVLLGVQCGGEGLWEWDGGGGGGWRLFNKLARFKNRKKTKKQRQAAGCDWRGPPADYVGF